MVVFLGLPAGFPILPALFQGLCSCGGVPVDKNLLVTRIFMMGGVWLCCSGGHPHEVDRVVSSMVTDLHGGRCGREVPRSQGANKVCECKILGPVDPSRRSDRKSSTSGVLTAPIGPHSLLKRKGATPPHLSGWVGRKLLPTKIHKHMRLP